MTEFAHGLFKLGCFASWDVGLCLRSIHWYIGLLIGECEKNKANNRIHNYTIPQGRGYHSKSWTFGWILWQWSDRYWPIPNESLQGKSSFRSLLFVTSPVLIFNANLVSSRAVCDSNTFDIQGYRNETVTLRSRLLSRLILLAIWYRSLPIMVYLQGSTPYILCLCHSEFVLCKIYLNI